jgi:hypothetical protein
MSGDLKLKIMTMLPNTLDTNDIRIGCFAGRDDIAFKITGHVLPFVGTVF